MSKEKILVKLNKLDAKLDELCKFLSGVDEKTLSVQPGPGRWSVLQVLAHLRTGEAMSQAYLRKKIQYLDHPRKLGLIHWIRSAVLQFSLVSPFKYKAPESVNFVDHSDFDFRSLVSEWKSDRKKLTELLASLDPQYFGFEIYRHPFVGRLGLGHMLSFFSGHFNRHHKQIMRTINEVMADADKSTRSIR